MENTDSNIDPTLCQLIVSHLVNLKEKKDSFEGLILGVCEDEVNRFKVKLTNNLSYLIEKGVVKEKKETSGLIHYELIKDYNKP